jgi:hypothetical protein
MACSSLARHVTSAHVSVGRLSATARSEVDTELTKMSSGRADLVRGAVGSKRQSLDGRKTSRIVPMPRDGLSEREQRISNHSKASAAAPGNFYAKIANEHTLSRLYGCVAGGVPLVPSYGSGGCSCNVNSRVPAGLEAAAQPLREHES